MTPDISCIIPTFNDRENLGNAVRSVLDQAGVDVECVLVDDLSNAQTRDYIADLAASDPRIRVFMLPENGGQAAARNIGAMIARAPLLTFLDQDDVHCDGWYRFAVQHFHTIPDMGSLSGLARVVDIPPRFGIGDSDLRIQGLSAVFMTNVIMRRSVFLASGGFPTDPIWRSREAGEDGMYRAALLRCWSGRSCEVPALIHRAREGGATVHFLDRSWVEHGEVRIRLSELEDSGVVEAATDALMADALRVFAELQACRNPPRADQEPS